MARRCDRRDRQWRPVPLPERCNDRSAVLSTCETQTSQNHRAWGVALPALRAIVAPRDSSSGGSMRQQTMPFIVEIKPSRKVKPIARKTSIWGKLDLAADRDTPAATDGRELPAAGEANDRR
ncbi:hypothetical protein NXC12_PD00475 (plasmid) [Rhizobium etli]|uniref:Uncharacterized protein n=2 Tax=Rhizobium/Agrobacterium group TaxID=227290 RepID=A0AAN1BN94_RHIET|nr:hypothetical protein NXC12_PD00475 [Rhizobium etli]